VRKRKRRAAVGEDAATAFARGFLVTGLLVGLQGRGLAGAAPVSGRKTLRQAVQGGATMAGGTLAADALARRDYSRAIAAVTAGAAGVLAAEYLLADKPNKREKGVVEEEG